MAYIINQARIRQRSLIITLLDLKNAFSEIHHNLVKSVLGYHHIPDHIQLIIKSLYTNFKTSVITSKFNTPFIQVSRGVLQGDCLSPLIFNLCFNSFIQDIKSEKYQQFSFSYVTVHGKTYVNDLGKCSLKSFVDRSLVVWNFYPFAKTF